MEKNKIRFDLFIIVFVGALILFYNLGSGSLTSWDEGSYGLVSREILKSNNWIDLTWKGEPWSDKPPLYMWVTVLFYKIFGVNEFSVRLFSSICGIGTAIVTYLFANKLYSRRCGFVAALILLSTQHFIWSSKLGMLDVALTFFIALSLFLFKLGEEKSSYLFFAFIAFTLGFLVKGTGALIIPIIYGFYVFLESITSQEGFLKEIKNKIAIFRKPAFLSAMILSLLILGWWHWAAFSNYGKDFVNGYFIKHLVLRTTSAVDGHTGNAFTYFKVLPNKGRPWAAFGMIAFFVAFYRLIFKKEKEHAIVLSWLFCVFLTFSLVKTKLHWYIVPIYPALSIILGWAISKLFKKFSAALMIILFVAAIIYLSNIKGIFNLDYSPGIKKIILLAEKILPKSEKVFLYDINDPAAQFYFCDRGINIKNYKEFEQVATEHNKYILFNKDFFEKLQTVSHYFVLEKTDAFVLAKTK